MIDDLKRLKELLDAGDITDEEFNDLKQRVLAGEKLVISDGTEEADAVAEAISEEPVVYKSVALTKQPKKKNVIVPVVISVVVIIGLIGAFFGIGKSQERSRSQLVNQVGTAVKLDNPDELLELFDQKSQKQAWSLVGSQALILIWKNEANNPRVIFDSASKNDSDLKYVYAGNYGVHLRHKKVMFFFDRYYLSAKPTKETFSLRDSDSKVRLTQDSMFTTPIMYNTKSKKVKQQVRTKMKITDVKKSGVFPNVNIFDLYDKAGNKYDSEVVLNMWR